MLRESAVPLTADTAEPSADAVISYGIVLNKAALSLWLS